MEHRLSSRVESATKVLLYKQGIPVATGRLRNFSQHGCFIQTEFKACKRNDLLELEISVIGSCGQERMRAMLIHTNAQGLGFMLDNHNEVRLPKSAFK